MLLFSGGGPKESRVPTKIYRAVFKDQFIIDPEEKQPCECILAHSLGLIKALLYCQEHSIQTVKRIVAIDPPDPNTLESKWEALKSDAQQLYLLFLARNPPNPCPVIVYRPEKSENKYQYDEVILYSEDTHYPFQIKKRKNQILASLLIPSIRITGCVQGDNHSNLPTQRGNSPV